MGLSRKVCLPSLNVFSLFLFYSLLPCIFCFAFTSIVLETFVAMGKIRPGPDPKAALVSDILALSRSPISCIHINRISSGSCFIDWYLILGIQEDAEVKVIRKRYHKLALKVHPDKNNHPKADIAFKLIHEAYLCLSDETKRRSFNIDRRNNICLKCSRVSHKSKENRNDSKPNRFCQTLKDIRDKFREENMVIERCLKTNSAFFMGNRTNETPPVYGIPKQNRINKESPVFNPSDYRLRGYPHVRNRVFDYNLSSDWNMFTRSRSTCVHSS